MSPTSPLAEVWQNYQLARDCFKITGRILSSRDTRPLSHTGFAEAPIEDARRIIKEGRKGWDDFVILSLWAAFERMIIEFVHDKIKILLSQQPREFSEELHKFVERQVEFLRMGDKLDMLKTVVDSELIGQAKQIKDYRDWVVHKGGTRPANIAPIQAYNVLNRIVSTISGL